MPELLTGLWIGLALAQWLSTAGFVILGGSNMAVTSLTTGALMLGIAPILASTRLLDVTLQDSLILSLSAYAQFVSVDWYIRR